MKNILSRENREILNEFAWSDVLLAFDFDGTLAPIVENPARARMRQETRRLLWELAKLCPIIVISGRAQPDALKKMRGVEPFKDSVDQRSIAALTRSSSCDRLQESVW